MDGSEYLKMTKERPPYGLSLVMMAFLAIAMFNGVEIIVKMFLTFQQRGGLYFWSILLATAGIFLYVIGFAVKFFVTKEGAPWVGLSFVVAGWVPMVSCQSLALYSRLHMVVRDERKLRWVFYMIITDAILFHTPTSLLIFLAETSQTMATVYTAYEKTELTAFSIQECIISGLYIYEASKTFLRPAAKSSKAGRRMRAIYRHLIYVNIIVVALDATLLATQYANHYRPQTTYKAFVYSVKLKLEFAILNRLVAAARNKKTAANYDPASAGSTRLATLQTGMSGGMQGTAAVSVSANPTVAADDDDEAAVGMEENRVMKTTEVRVESHGRDEETELREEWARSSRASSEIQFAAAGY
ncbi:integral membrane protein [Macrophomina phaseolina]|uniref:Integral membrane protein n=1 Tax=Macrophomina phaseolina TaxID=35725 RepID=A0ABQ8G1V7_9PEZI|nr:integral membrane protein [Macrophomina phaseolina]